MKGRSALVLGATGLVGGLLLDELLASSAYDRVVTLARRRTDRAHAKLEQLVIDFDRLEEAAERIRGDDLFCCLGTTIKKAGSQAAFARVDLEYPLRIARIAVANGVRSFLLVSSIGADSASRNFYLRTKGRLEDEIRGAGFQTVEIFRPSLLLGEREEKRAAERAAIVASKALGFLMIGPLARYRPTPAERVASRMVRAAVESRPGVRLHEPV